VRAYSVYQRPRDNKDQTIFVRETFSWTAFVFGLPWVAYLGLWKAIGALLVIYGALCAAWCWNVFSTEMFWLTYGICNLFLGLQASVLQGWALERRGFSISAVILGESLEGVEVRFFSSEAMKSAT